MKKCCWFFIGMLLSTHAFGKVITVGFSFSKPPYVFAPQFAEIDIYAAQNGQLGIEIDILKAIFAGTDFTFKPTFDTFHRIISELDEGVIDAAETSGPRQKGIYYSDSLIGCENYAITKRSASIIIDKIEDLHDKWIVAWQGAATDLGDRFHAIATNNPKYSENHDQEAQYKMFHAGRVDVIVIDKYIFMWWDAQYAQRDGKKESYVYHAIFPGVNEYRIGFRSPEIRNLFDKRLKQIKKNGVYDRIIQKYMDTMNL